MSLFYLNLCSGTEFVEDQEGIDLLDYAAAYHLALESLRGVMAGDLLTGELNTATFVEIEDEHHSLLQTVFFDEAVSVREELPANGTRKQRLRVV